MDQFGRYTVFECLGAGGMATVHRATIEIGGGVIREVALKRMLPQLVDDKKTLDDFIREAKLAAQLNHPNIVRILELGRNATTYFIAMELVRGHSLLQLMKLMNAKRETTPIGIVIAVLAELCDALDYASSATDVEGEPMEIVHRDLSPSNLIIDTEGHLKIIDFGVAKTTSGKFQTSSGLVKGKLGYMALEVLAGKPVDRRADIFSVGVVAWELLTGRRLFTAANEYDVITKIRKGATVKPSELNIEVSPELDEIVMHALSRKRDERWPSAGVMKNALDTLRRTHREGPREVNNWRVGLVPEVELHHEDSTTMELMSLGDLIVKPSSPSITETTKMTVPPLDVGHYEEALDDEDDIPTQMVEIPRAPTRDRAPVEQQVPQRPSDSHFGLVTEPHEAILPVTPRPSESHFGLVTEPHEAILPQVVTDTSFDALPSRDSRSSKTFDEVPVLGSGSGNKMPPRDTQIGHEIMGGEDDDEHD